MERGGERKWEVHPPPLERNSIYRLRRRRESGEERRSKSEEEGRGGTLNASSSDGAAKDGGRDRGVRGGKEGDVEEICNWGRIVKRGESESEEGKGWRKRPIRSISALRCH